MPPNERNKRVRELFESASVLTGTERRTWLAQLAGDDAALRDELASLLAHHDEASIEFLETPVWSEGAAAPRTPEAIGPFRILRELGRGGMGVVYLAEQERPRRTVALKVLRPGLADAHALRRFEHESQMLARLRHPGIAQIFEAGSADWGLGPQPYFALEYVEGPTLAEFVAARDLGTRARLELVAQLCDALDHAHHRGVIHRDLKPSNVLVDTSGAAPRIKVLDFGVARVTDLETRTPSLRTDVGQVIGTLAYMSPEQAAGETDNLDARSDVYSIGVIGYELLAGRLPLEVRDKPLLEAVRVVRQDEPTALSRVRPVLRGELEVIFSKTLEKERSRRYESAAELANDLRRYLSDEPIHARPPSRVYVLSKFVRRNRVLVGGLVGVFIALLVGLVATLRQAQVTAAERDRADDAAKEATSEGQRAEREARRARAVADFQRTMLSRVSPELDGRDVRLAQVLDAAAAALPGDLAGDAAAEGGVRATLGESYQALGMLEPAEREFRLAWPLLSDSLGEDHEETLNALGWLASVVADRGRDAEAVELLERALRARAARFGPGDAETLVFELNLADMYIALGRLDEAEPLARANVEKRRELLGERDISYVNGLLKLGEIEQARGRLDEAAAWMQRSLELAREIDGPTHPDTLVRGAMLSTVYQQAGRNAEAESLLRAALDLGRERFGADHFQVLAWEHNLAALLEGCGALEEAEELYARVLDGTRTQLGDEHADTQIVLDSLTRMLIRQGRFAEALPLLELALEIQIEALPAEDPALALTVERLAQIRARLAFAR